MHFSATFIAAVVAAGITRSSAHSWVSAVGDGIQRGGLTKDDTTNTHYYCPTDNLDDCQPDARQTIRLTAANQRPCVAGRSPTLGKGTAGQPVAVSWPSNGHNNSQSDGTCVTVRIAKYADDPSNSDFKTLESCLPYHVDGVTGGNVTLPADLADGDYTVHWYWDFASYFYSGCVDIEVGSTGSSSAATTTGAPTEGATERKASETTDENVTVPTDSPSAKKSTKPPKPTEAQIAQYKAEGCNSMEDSKSFCKGLTGKKSYCKTFLEDSCGRSHCLGDGSKFDRGCTKKTLLI